MSLIRLSRPGYLTEYVDLGPSVGRRTMSRYGVKGGGPPIVGALVTGDTSRYSAKVEKRTGAHSPKVRP